MESSRSRGLDEFGDPTELVAAGYDQVSQQYAELALQANETKQRHTNLILERLAGGSDVLDLGCGAGQPTTAILAERFKVTGLRDAGFELESADVVTQTFDGEDETHLWVVARRPIAQTPTP